METFQTDLKIENLNVAILISDINEAKRVSDALREFGIFAQYYQSLDEYWVAVNSQTPDFSIVDVKCMSQGSLVFVNHPKVKSDLLNFSFYYTDGTRALLNSTYNLNHFGLLRSSLSLTGQLKSIFTHLEVTLKNDNKKKNLESRISRLQRRGAQLITDMHDSNLYREQFSLMMSLVKNFQDNLETSSFMDSTVTLFNTWDSIKSFSIYELNNTKQKLRSPQFNRRKYKALPSLWLGQVSETGIETFAQDMAVQVGMDVLGENIQMFKVKGETNNPDLIVLMDVNLEQLQGFDWKIFSEFITSEYRRYKLNTAPVQVNRFITPWEAFTLQDEIHYMNKNIDLKLINISFTKLISTIKEKVDNRFNYKAFYHDFMVDMAKNINKDAHFTHYGVHQLLIYTEADTLDIDLKNIQLIVDKFQYWRYFEDSSLIITKDFTPAVKLMSPSSLNYLRHLETEMDEFGAEIKPNYNFNRKYTNIDL